MKSPRRGEHPNQTIRVRFELSFVFAEPAGHGSQEAAGVGSIWTLSSESARAGGLAASSVA